MNTTGHRTEVRAQRLPFLRDRIEVMIWQEHWWPGGRKLFAARPLTLEELTPENEGHEQPATLSLQQDEAQQLMDDLWRCGLRPSEGSGSAGQLAATQSHLSDMRKLAFKACGVEA